MEQTLIFSKNGINRNKFHMHGKPINNKKINNKEIIKIYTVIWNRINSLFKKEFDSKPIYKKKYIKTRINLYNPLFLNKRKSKGECYLRTSVLLLDSIVDVNKKHYPLVFSNECKYIVSKQGIEVISALDKELIVADSDDKLIINNTDDEYDEYDKFNKD